MIEDAHPECFKDRTLRRLRKAPLVASFLLTLDLPNPHLNSMTVLASYKGQETFVHTKFPEHHFLKDLHTFATVQFC